MIKGMLALFGVAIIGIGAAGCADEGTATQTTETQSGGAYVVADEPAGALPVGDARQNVQDQDDIVLVGRIGGSAKPFVDGVAAFTIVDEKVPYCAPEEGCPTPWDYCCEQNQVKSNIAMVKLVDEDGNSVAEDARQLLGVEELSTVVVRGKAQRDGEGNLAVLANQIYVKK